MLHNMNLYILFRRDLRSNNIRKFPADVFLGVKMLRYLYVCTIFAYNLLVKPSFCFFFFPISSYVNMELRFVCSKYVNAGWGEEK